MIKIFLEGKDTIFIKFLCDEMFDKHTVESIKIDDAKGWTNIPSIANQLKDNTDSGGKNLLIFDADSIKNDGGFDKRKKEIEEFKKQLGVSFELFLFPDNKNDGDYEFLLETIINPEHKGLLDCFDKYETCISQYKSEDGEFRYKIPIRKSKIYSYIDAFPKSRKINERFKKGDWFFEDKEIWIMTHEILTPLKDFLINNTK